MWMPVYQIVLLKCNYDVMPDWKKNDIKDICFQQSKANPALESSHGQVITSKYNSRNYWWIP